MNFSSFFRGCYCCCWWWCCCCHRHCFAAKWWLGVIVVCVCVHFIYFPHNSHFAFSFRFYEPFNVTDNKHKNYKSGSVKPKTRKTERNLYITWIEVGEGSGTDRVKKKMCENEREKRSWRKRIKATTSNDRRTLLNNRPASEIKQWTPVTSHSAVMQSPGESFREKEQKWNEKIQLTHYRCVLSHLTTTGNFSQNHLKSLFLLLFISRNG